MNDEQIERQRTANLALQVVIAIFLATLVGINGWALRELTIIGKQVIRNTERLDSFAGAGERYMLRDAERDQGVVLRLLEAQGKQIEDHEGRIRITERTRN